MATISAADVKRLREATNAGIMDCKRALAEVDGDFDKAVTYLREKGIAGAGKKAGRATGEGLIGVHVSDDGKTAGIIEVNCETDFVARNDNFRALVSGLAQQVEKGASSVDELNAQTFGDSGKTVEEHVRESIATVGENIVLQRLERLDAGSGVLGAYVHSDGKQAAVVEISTSTPDEKAGQLARDLAMQVVALRPEFVNREEVPQERVDAERAIYAEQAAQEGKPEAIQTKIAEGRLSKEFFQLVALMDQGFVKEQKQTIAQLVKQHGDAKVVRFVRFRVGEGLQMEETEVEAA